MEDKDEISTIYDIIIAYQENNDILTESNNNSYLFNELTENINDNNKNKICSTIQYNKMYIVNKAPLEEIKKRIKYDDAFSNMSNENKMKKKIKKLGIDSSSINLQECLSDIQIYNNEEKVNEIFNKKIKVSFVKEEFLKSLGIKEEKYNEKYVYLGIKKNFISLFFPEELKSMLINISFLSDDTNNISQNEDNKNNINNNDDTSMNDKNYQNHINEISNKDNNINNTNQIINDNNFSIYDEELNKEINHYFEIVDKHLKYLDSINYLQAINISDIKDVNRIETILFGQNIHTMLYCYLIDSENFNKYEQEIFYDDYQSFILQNDNNDKKEQYNEIFEKMKTKKNKELKYDLKIINNYKECSDLINNKNDIQFMLVDDDFCSYNNMDKNYIGKLNICIFKTITGNFLFFKEEKKILKIEKTAKFYKIEVGDRKKVDIPKNIIDDLVTLYEQAKSINGLFENELKDNNFDNYYIINKNWLDQYKQYYNFEEIVIQYEEQNCGNEDKEEKNTFPENNQNPRSNKRGKNKNNNKKKKYNNSNNNNKNNYKKINKKYDIKVQYIDNDYPQYLLDINNILPNYQFYINDYPSEFELIKMDTLKRLCDNLKIKPSSEIFNKITFKALLGNDNLIIQGDHIGNILEIFESIGINYIYEYLIIFDDKELMDQEIKIIKEKGIEEYLTDMNLNLDEHSLQYLIDEKNMTMIGKVYIINKGQYNRNNIKNINNNVINNNSSNNNIPLNNTYEYSNTRIEKINPCRLGLDNIGATCYMNATLQCLCNVIQLQKYFLNNTRFNSHAKLSKAFSIVMQNLYDTKKNKKSYSPNNFKEIISKMNPLFQGIAANDSKDLILFIFEKIHEELNICNNYNNSEQNLPYELQIFRRNYYSNNSSIIEKTFYYEIQTINQCSTCKNQVINYSIQNLVIFPLEKIRLNCIKKYPNGFSYVTLQECFEQISYPEFMQGMNEIYCNKCCNTSTSLNQTFMNTCPEIMTIILNRGKGNEYDVEFDFPLRIDINNYVNFKNNGTIYDLIGVLVHIGDSSMSGHFFAFCKSNIDNNWYLYNDSIVSKCTDNYEYEIKNKGLPYVLFYQNINYINNNNNNFNNNNCNEMITLYFRTQNGKEIYLDVNSNDFFYNIIQLLAQKYNSNNFDYMNANYFINTFEGIKPIDIKKTILENNLSNHSIIIIG